MAEVDDNEAGTTPAAPPLSWARSDPERRFLFPGGRFTRAGAFSTLVLGSLLAGAFYLAVAVVPESPFTEMFLRRGAIPVLIVVASGWAVAILIVKWAKLRLQRRALDFLVVPADPGFVLTPRTVDEVVGALYETADDPRQFVLFNRILIALSNLRNLGRVGDVDEILRSQAESDEAMAETSYQLLQGLIWATPVLGFIGTVVGLSDAIGGFGGVLAASGELGELKDALRHVTGGLSLAFETTLQGLVAALAIQLATTGLRVAEHQFLDDCREYGLRHIVGRLRLTLLEPGAGAES